MTGPGIFGSGTRDLDNQGGLRTLTSLTLDHYKKI